MKYFKGFRPEVYIDWVLKFVVGSNPGAVEKYFSLSYSIYSFFSLVIASPIHAIYEVHLNPKFVSDQVEC